MRKTFEFLNEPWKGGSVYSAAVAAGRVALWLTISCYKKGVCVLTPSIPLPHLSLRLEIGRKKFLVGKGIFSRPCKSNAPLFAFIGKKMDRRMSPNMRTLGTADPYAQHWERRKPGSLPSPLELPRSAGRRQRWVMSVRCFFFRSFINFSDLCCQHNIIFRSFRFFWVITPGCFTQFSMKISSCARLSYLTAQCFSKLYESSRGF